VAGSESPLLQISQDERARVGRLASQFSEEDLTRFLNIALRTHDELGYKQEQRFHLELGVLKMVHAQRMLPLEELLSQQPMSGSSARPQPAAAPTSRPVAPEPQRRSSTETDRGSGASAPSPFESDRARKGRSSAPEMSSGANVAVAEAVTKSTAIATAAAVATAIAIAEAVPENIAKTNLPDIAASTPGSDLEQVRGAVVGALEAEGQAMLANLLDGGEWSLQGAELTIKVAASNVMIEMSFGAEPKKLATAAASQSAGRAIRVKVVSGGTVNAIPAQAAHRGTSRPSGSARSRAAEDPIVRYMQEKFGAEIRTVIDQQSQNKDQQSND
jgi:DNA polymerase-3 subunit gamma/tau